MTIRTRRSPRHGATAGEPESEPAPASPHRPDGSDSDGAGLELAITISRDGTLLFGDLTAELLPVAAALCPGDPLLRRRLALAERMRPGATAPATPCVQESGRGPAEGRLRAS